MATKTAQKLFHWVGGTSTITLFIQLDDKNFRIKKTGFCGIWTHSLLIISKSS